MRRTAALGIGAIALALSACSGLAEVPPPSPSVADLDSFHARMLELTWDGFGIPPALAAPPVEPELGLGPAEWGAALRSCMAEGGFPDFGYSWSHSEGYVLLGIRHDAVRDQEEQMVFYFCVAAHPLVPDENGMLVSVDQRNYVYDYYARWTVPCLIDHGYTLRRVISREDFDAAMGEWVPYWELPMYSAEDHERVIALCGPDRPPLPPSTGAEASP